MTPREYKGKTVIHVPTDKRFVVTGGQKRKNGWFLKDETENIYPFEECRLTEINSLEFDTRKIREAKNLKALSRHFEIVGFDRFHSAWQELEKDSVEAAATAVLYCENWWEFCSVVQTYGVSVDQSPEFNKQFRLRIREKGLEPIVADWHKEAV